MDKNKTNKKKHKNDNRLTIMVLKYLDQIQ